MSDETAGQLLELFEALGALPQTQAGANLGRALRAALDAVARPPERWDHAEAAVRIAARHALALDRAVAPDAAWMAKLGAALDACVHAQPAPVALHEPRPSGRSELLRSHAQPRRWPGAEALGALGEGLAPAPPDVDDADPPGVEGDVAPTDAAPTDAPRPPLALAPVDAWTPDASDSAKRVAHVVDAAASVSPELVATRWAERALDSLAMHLQHRAELTFTRAPDEDERALAFLDAVRVDARGVAGAIRSVWGRHVESPEPWAAAAVMLVISSLHGDEALRAVPPLMRVAPTDDASTAAAAEGLVLGGHPGLAVLAKEMLRSGAAPARALALDLARRLGVLGTDDLRAALCDPSVVVACAAARAVVAPGLVELAPLVVSMLRHPAPAVSCAAALALTASGRTDAIDRVRADAAFARSLGVTAIELLALGGDERDLELVGGLGRKLRPSAALFDALARFGHARAWLFLSHHLANEDTQDDAASALEALFGELVEAHERTDAPAWRAAIASQKLDPDTRLCRGKAWHPSRLRPLMESGESRVALELRARDFAVRTGVAPTLDLSGWAAERATAAASFDAALRPARDVTAGRWLPVPERSEATS